MSKSQTTPRERLHSLLLTLTICVALACRNESVPAERVKSQPRASLEKASVRLKWLHQAQFAGFYFAKEAGLYAQNGVDVTLRPGGVDYPAIQMVASGSDQFGVTGADQIILAREKGIPVVAVACIYRRSPFVLFSLVDSGITRVENFRRRKIGVKLGGNEELTYRAMLRNAGLHAEDVTEIPVKFDISPLLAKGVDVWPGYSINEPITAEEKGFKTNLIWPDAYGVHLYADVLFTTEEMLKTHPSMVRAVVAGTVEGWQRAFADRVSAVTYTLRYGQQLTPQHERRMLDASYSLIKPDGRPIGTMDLAVWRDMQKLLRSAGFTHADIDLEKAYRIDFLPSTKS